MTLLTPLESRRVARRKVLKRVLGIAMGLGGGLLVVCGAATYCEGWRGASYLLCLTGMGLAVLGDRLVRETEEET